MTRRIWILVAAAALLVILGSVHHHSVESLLGSRGDDAALTCDLCILHGKVIFAALSAGITLVLVETGQPTTGPDLLPTPFFGAPSTRSPPVVVPR